ncbi:MAG: LytTR family DNA-binding domain-containing protein [Bacteroidales bacterium]|nr:LytTR family DNA-binding domain-containing protein [Bacteroidales bacterium]MDD4603576.1 LytTR family DNA-binding domain-containing protein [Bacteroidales bacterium]
MDKTTKIVLIDDDKTVILSLSTLLATQFHNMEVVGVAHGVREGIQLIDSTTPDLVFLDINMPDGEGFEVIERVTYKNFQVIFITAFDKYAVRAFEFSALHYLIKPVTLEMLESAINRYKDVKVDEIDNRLNVLRDSLKSKNEKIIIPSTDGLNIVKLSDIIRLEASDVYTLFFMANGQRFVASKPLNNYERILEDLPFSRVHSKHLINLMYIKRYIKGKGGSVILEDNTEVEVSVRKKADFIEKLKNFARFV